MSVPSGIGQVPRRAARPVRSGRRARAGRSALESATGEASGRRLPLPVYVFLVAILIPWIFTIGPMRLSAYRFVLLAMLGPCLVMWLQGKAGRIRLTDVALVLFCIYGALALAVVHGAGAAVQPSGILFIETMGAYLLARCYIRGPDDFYNLVRLLFLIVVALLPLAILEAVTGHNYAQEALKAVLPVSNAPSLLQPRWGLTRVRVVFEHPILFGVATGSVLALTHLVLGYGVSFARRWLRSATVAATAFLSLSSGPVSALAAQILLLSWNGLLVRYAHRWKLLGAIVFCCYAVVAIGSNQSVLEFYIYYFAFNEGTGWDRIRIWRYGWQTVQAHPLFGIGFGDWARPDWMGSSIDMFWLVNFVQFGMPAGALMLIAFFALLIAVGRQKSPDERHSAYKLAYLIAMFSFFLAGWAVHYWNALYVLFLFMLGSGAWLLDTPQGEVEATEPRARRAGRFSQAATMPTVSRTDRRPASAKSPAVWPARPRRGAARNAHARPSRGDA